MKEQDRSGLPPVPLGARARLERRWPRLIALHARTPHGGLPGDQRRRFNHASTRLARMIGWIDGLLEEAELAQQIAANDEAYAGYWGLNSCPTET